MQRLTRKRMLARVGIADRRPGDDGWRLDLGGGGPGAVARKAAARRGPGAAAAILPRSRPSLPARLQAYECVQVPVTYTQTLLSHRMPDRDRACDANGSRARERDADGHVLHASTADRHQAGHPLCLRADDGRAEVLSPVPVTRTVSARSIRPTARPRWSTRSSPA